MTISNILVGVVKARGDQFDFRARFESFIKEYASADSLTVSFSIFWQFREFCDFKVRFLRFLGNFLDFWIFEISIVCGA